MKLTPQQKTSLLEAGTWPDFQRYRSELEGKGANGRESMQAAICKFFGQRGLDESKTVRDISREKKKADKEQLSPIVVDMAQFDGRDGTSLDIVKWVTRNLDVEVVDLEGCPDATAITLLNECRKDSKFRDEFWAKFFTKTIPTKGPENEEDDQVILDGRVTIELIERIQKVRDKVLKKVEAV
ncbi:MAG: hypothetical protein ABIH23_20385 [bacterium]